MERFFDNTKTKDKFLKDTLLKYLLDKVDKEPKNNFYCSDSEDVAGMAIFPFKSDNGTMLSSLDDVDKKWYYPGPGNAGLKIISSTNVRLLDEEFLGDDSTLLIKKLYGEDYIKEFSYYSVIEDLIQKMSVREEFDETWWSCCRDVYDLWIKNDKKIFNSEEAVRSIKNNNAFIFNDENYCSTTWKKRLEKNYVFTDLLSSEQCSRFFKYDQKKALSELLVSLGVPNRFTKDKEYNNLERLFKKMYDDCYYPISKSDKYGYALAELSEYIVLKVLDEDRNAFNLMYDKEDCRKGMMVKNSDGQYISLSNSLFYINSKQKVLSSYEYDQDAKQDHRFDMLLIDVGYLPTGFDSIPSIINPEKINQENFDHIKTDRIMDEDFGWFVSRFSLYKWLWQYNKSTDFADCVLEKMSERKFTSENGLAGFAIDVIYNCSFISEEYFEIILSVEDAFKYSDLINKSFCIEDDNNYYKCIFITLNDTGFNKIHHYDCDKIKDSIVNDIEGKIDEIDENVFWDKIYYVECDSETNENYVVLDHRNNEYDFIILVPSSDPVAIKRCIKKYIHEQFNVDVDRMDEGLIDWAQEYRILKKGLLDFVTPKISDLEIDTKSDTRLDVRDISDFSEEKLLWDEVRKTRRKVLKANSRFDSIPFGIGKPYLQDKYRGYCQICGARTPSQSFHQLHIVEPHEFQNYKNSIKSLEDLEVNLLCTCPSCWGHLKHGNMTRDLSNIEKAAYEYVKYFLENENYFEDGEPLLAELSDEDGDYCIKDMINPGDNNDYIIQNPIVFKVIVDGEEREMFFAWEHFIRIAMLLNEDEIYKDED